MTAGPSPDTVPILTISTATAGKQDVMTAHKKIPIPHPGCWTGAGKISNSRNPSLPESKTFIS